MALSAKAFQGPLLQVLGNLSHFTVDRDVHCEETYLPVMAIMGITDIKAYGVETPSGIPWVQRWITFASKNLRESGLVVLKGRGRWALTTAGLADLIPPSMPVAPIIATVDLPKSPSALEPLSVPAPQSVPEPTTSRPHYYEDAYLLRLVMEQTPCVGHYTAHKGGLCLCCPLQAECRQVQETTWAQTATRLAQKDRVAVIAPDLSITPPSATPPSNPPSDLKVTKANLTNVICFVETECHSCGQTIPKGEWMTWLKDSEPGQTLVFHTACANALCQDVP
jgi:hypothetical protein